MTPKPRARKKKISVPEPLTPKNDPAENVADMMDDLSAPDPETSKPFPGGGVSVLLKQLLDLNIELLSPWEKKFVENLKSGGMAMDPKNLSIATSILRRYGG